MVTDESELVKDLTTGSKLAYLFVASLMTSAIAVVTVGSVCVAVTTAAGFAKYRLEVCVDDDADVAVVAFPESAPDTVPTVSVLVLGL